MPKIKVEAPELEIVGVPVCTLQSGEVFILDDSIGLRLYDGAILMSAYHSELEGDAVGVYNEDELEDFENVIPRPDLQARIVFERK